MGTPCVIARRSTERPETIWTGATVLEGQEGEGILYKKINEAWQMKTDWDRGVLNPTGKSPSEEAYKDLIKKIESDYFIKNRSFQQIKNKKPVRDAYGL